MKSTTRKTKSTACALLAILSLSAALTGCATASRENADLRQLYQPPVLRLQAGLQIVTRDGLYLPQVNEVWHSDARFCDLEARYIDALAAVAALKK